MRLPSGDQTGWLSRQVPLVSSRVREPSISTIQRLLTRSSLTLSTQDRVNTICRPSGEMAGLVTLSISIKVSLFRVPLSATLFLDWANAPKESESRASNTTVLERRSFVIIRTSYETGFAEAFVGECRPAATPRYGAVR